jgi:hypothetical protein
VPTLTLINSARQTALRGGEASKQAVLFCKKEPKKL